MNKFFRIFALSLFFTYLAMPLYSQENPDRASPDFAESRPRSMANDELVVVFSNNDLELDFRSSFMASEAQFFTAIYEGLFSYHPLTMEPIRAAAASWELSEDRRRWTFNIRENARFENGDPLRAEDFRAAWISLLDPDGDAPYSSLFDVIEGARDYRLGRGSAENIGIFTPAEKTLVVQLNAPAAFFPSMLCHHSFSPIHPSMLENDNWQRPISNGPFYIEEKDEDKIVLLKNGEYWDADRISLNKLTVKFAADGEDAASMWNSGEARWIQGDVNFDALTDRSGIEVNAMFATHYYFVRSARKPWDDFRLRRALTLALPWEEIREGHILPANTLIYPIPNYPIIDGLDTTDLEEARRLMAEAGFPGGAGLPELVIRITPSREAERIAQLMTGAWFSGLGVPIRIDVVPFRQYIQSLNLDDYDVGSITWIGDFADPYTFLKMWSRDSNLNDAGHDDDDFEVLIERSMSEEGITRWETLAEAEELLLYRGNVLPISFSPAVNIIDLDEIEGWFPNILDIHPFKYLGIRMRRPLPGVVMGNEPAYSVFTAAYSDW
ncbi:MAG: peptide ABC transporter substrate-binding protein [Treponema sp.]|nr:peptide ABC transporter substrate-binding protein [Treponema sp.]